MTHPDVGSKDDVAKTLGVGKSSTSSHRARRWLFWTALVIVILIIGVSLGIKDETNGVQYATQPVQRGDLVVTVSATGTLQPIKKVDVGIEVSGTIKTVEVDYNDKITNGQVLARLDTTKLEAQVLQSVAALDAAKAKVAQAQANVRLAKAQWERYSQVRKLSGGKMPSQTDLDTAEATLASYQADEANYKATVAQCQATLDVNRTDLSKAIVRSPINGIVLSRSIEPGQTVAATMTTPVLFTLAEDLTKMELQVDVDEADVGQVNKGQSATFTVDAYPDRQFPAQVSLVHYAATTNANVVTYRTILNIDNAAFLLRPSMTATAVITVNKRTNALLVANAAFRFVPPQTQTAKAKESGGLLSALLPRPPRSDSFNAVEDTNEKSKIQRVWTLRNGQLTVIPVTKGPSNGTVTEITDGALEPGMELITEMIAAKQ